jgi:serine/threonine protein kinase
MKAGALNLDEVLDVATQVASALSAAHAAGIVHRDIKPENVMLRRDGIVKTLDFGIAKLTERLPTGSSETKAPTVVRYTEQGLVLGTDAYMSPEQARARAVDGRSDIWSLGVVLYEMVAGRVPFAGETSSHVIVAILEHDPAPLARFAPGAPADLQRIVRKCLEKDLDERYQTARNLMIDLKNVRRDLELQGEIDRSTATHDVGAPAREPRPPARRQDERAPDVERRACRHRDQEPQERRGLDCRAYGDRRGGFDPVPSIPRYPAADRSGLDPSDGIRQHDR